MDAKKIEKNAKKILEARKERLKSASITEKERKELARLVEEALITGLEALKFLDMEAEITILGDIKNGKPVTSAKDLMFTHLSTHSRKEQAYSLMIGALEIARLNKDLPKPLLERIGPAIKEAWKGLNDYIVNDSPIAPKLQGQEIH